MSPPEKPASRWTGDFLVKKCIANTGYVKLVLTIYFDSGLG